MEGVAREDELGAGLGEHGRSGLRVLVQREDTDCLGIVYSRQFLAMFERGREELITPALLASLFRATGESFVVTRSEQLFKKPAMYGDELVVRTIPILEGKFRLHFDQSIWLRRRNGHDEDQLLVAGFVEMVTVSRDFQLTSVPAPVEQLFTSFSSPHRLTYLKPKPKVPMPKSRKQGLPEMATFATFDYDLHIHQADTDFTGIAFHPNYYRWFEQARSEMLSAELLLKVRNVDVATPVIRSAKLTYKNGARPYEALRVISTPAIVAASKHVVTFNQRLTRLASGQLLVEAEFEIVFVHAESQALIPIPPTILAALESNDAEPILDGIPSPQAATTLK